MLTKTHVLNLLHRLIDRKQTDHPLVDPPDALALETAPKANVDHYDDLVAQGAPAFEAATPMLSQLLKAEMAEREVRSIAYHTKVARFPSDKDLAGFDFKFGEINEGTVRQLHRRNTIKRGSVLGENTGSLRSGNQQFNRQSRSIFSTTSALSVDSPRL